MPRWSIIIPTFQRSSAFRETLACLTHLDPVEGGFEVIVVNDGGAWDDSVLSERPALVRVVHQENAGPAAARNRGIQEAEGAFLALTDDDCRPLQGWLTAYDSVLRDNQSLLCSGPVKNALTTNLFAATSQDVVDYLRVSATGTVFAPSNNLAMLREAALELGGFSESFRIAGGEDRDFCQRWLASGREIREVPEARVDHYHQMRLLEFSKQHFRYGRGAAHFLAGGLTAPNEVGDRPWERPLRLCRYPLRKYGSKRGIPRFFAMAWAQLLTFLGFGLERLTLASKTAANQ
jgi:GT2 family glycosyltransferase